MKKIDNSGSDEEIPPPKGLLVSTPQKNKNPKSPRNIQKDTSNLLDELEKDLNDTSSGDGDSTSQSDLTKLKSDIKNINLNTPEENTLSKSVESLVKEGKSDDIESLTKLLDGDNSSSSGSEGSVDEELVKLSEKLGNIDLIKTTSLNNEYSESGSESDEQIEQNENLMDKLGKILDQDMESQDLEPNVEEYLKNWNWNLDLDPDNDSTGPSKESIEEQSDNEEKESN